MENFWDIVEFIVVVVGVFMVSTVFVGLIIAIYESDDEEWGKEYEEKWRKTKKYLAQLCVVAVPLFVVIYLTYQDDIDREKRYNEMINSIVDSGENGYISTDEVLDLINEYIPMDE